MLFTECLCCAFSTAHRFRFGVSFAICFRAGHVARASLFRRFPRNGFFAWWTFAAFDGFALGGCCWFISGTSIKAKLIAHDFAADFVDFALL